jgi:D-alanine-D-alanine ligase
MRKKKFKILVIFESPEYLINRPYEVIKHKEWQDENDVVKALIDLEQKVFLQGIANNIGILGDTIKKVKPDLIFNLCETFNKKRHFESSIASFCALMQIPYTGACPMTIQLCQDKSISKKIISFHEIKTPTFSIAKPQTKNIIINKLPAIVKPLASEASEGICASSFVKTRKECISRVNYIHKKLQSSALIEDYINGYDTYVGIIGDKNITVFEPVIVEYKKYSQKKPNIATYNAKWNDSYRKKWGIKSKKLNLDKIEITRIKNFCKKIYSILNLKGYCRLDLRITPDLKIYFIEANPNPAIAKQDDFSLSAKLYGYEYNTLIKKIIQTSFNNKN